MEYSNIWKKIRIRYCILKSLVSGPKSEQELLDQICLFPEFRPIKYSKWDSGELATGINLSIQDLKNEFKIKKRDILNTHTKERRIEWFLNQAWLSETNLFKKEISRVRLLEEIALNAKAEHDRLQREKEDRERREEIERIDQERAIKLKKEQSESAKAKVISDKSDDLSFNSVVTGILSLVAVVGGVYVIGKIGDSLSRAFTFPVFLITCAVGFSIYYLTMDKEK
jgi:hypothetical protein